MDRHTKKQNPKKAGGDLFSSKNYISFIEKILDSRHKQLIAIIFIIGVLIMVFPDKNISKNNSENLNEEIKLAGILEQIEGCGEVSVMITYSQPDEKKYVNGQAKGAIVVAEGADDIVVNNKICEAVQAALNLPAHKVKVYKLNRED